VKGIKAKKSGYKKGFPDLFIYEPRGEFNGLAIELKVGKNRATKEQLWWRNELNERGYVAEICTGIDEALEVINRYLKNKIK
jgi:REP element-mobilizing transposase RayT